MRLHRIIKRGPSDATSVYSDACIQDGCSREVLLLEDTHSASIERARAHKADWRG
jgi:hypothetical protein